MELFYRYKEAFSIDSFIFGFIIALIILLIIEMVKSVIYEKKTENNTQFDKLVTFDEFLGIYGISEERIKPELDYFIYHTSSSYPDLTIGFKSGTDIRRYKKFVMLNTLDTNKPINYLTTDDCSLDDRLTFSMYNDIANKYNKTLISKE